MESRQRSNLIWHIVGQNSLNVYGNGRSINWLAYFSGEDGKIIQLIRHRSEADATFCDIMASATRIALCDPVIVTFLPNQVKKITQFMREKKTTICKQVLKT